MMRILQKMVILVSTASAVVAASATAEAQGFRRYPSATCFADTDPVWDMYVRNGGGGVANSGWYRQYLVCPIIDDDAYDRRVKPIQFVDMHFWDGNTTDGASATACVAYYHTWGGECSPGLSSAPSYRGWAKVQLAGTNIDVLNRRWWDFAYIFAELPREDGGWHSSLQGYHVQY